MLFRCLSFALLVGVSLGCSEKPIFDGEQNGATVDSSPVERPSPKPSQFTVKPERLHFSRDESEPRVEIVAPESLSASYANEFRLQSGEIELVLDFGVVSEDRKGDGRRFEIAHRIAMNYYTAKRVLSAFDMALKRHEQAFGELNPQEPPKPATIESPSRVAYANFCRVMSTPEELALDCGFNPQPYATGKQTVNVSHRLVMLHPTAKRLFVALNNALGSYEKEHGVLETDVRKRVTPGLR